MNNFEQQALAHLKEIAVLMGDVNAIRNGEYDPPRGSNPSSEGTIAQPDDLHSQLGEIAELLHRQNQILDKIGRAVVDTSGADLRDDYWEWLDRS